VNDFDLGFAAGMHQDKGVGSIGFVLGETKTWHVLTMDAKSDNRIVQKGGVFKRIP
jgi:hypothetical protein